MGTHAACRTPTGAGSTHRPDDVDGPGERRCRHSRSRRILGAWPHEHRALARPATTPRPSRSPPANGKTNGKANGKATARARAAARRDPDGGHGEIHDQLVAAVEETARLLEADGAMVYLLDPETGHLRFAHDAGIKSERSRAFVRSIRLPIGTGMFGNAVARRAVVHTDDYLADPAFDHAPDPDKVVEDMGIRSMVAAPIVSGDEVFGALGAFSTRPSAFSASQLALVRALADHAAVAMANARLIEALDHSRSELAQRAEAERSLREINARISAAADLPAVLQRAVDEAARLLDAEGARIDLVDPRLDTLRPAYASGDNRLDAEEWPEDPDETIDEGISGKAVVTGQAAWTGDYVNDAAFHHGKLGDDYVTSGRDPLRHGRAARGRGGAVRCPDDLHEAPGRLGGDGRGTARRDRRPGGDHDHDDAIDRGARSVARGARAGVPRPSRHCARWPPGSPCCASPRRSSRTSSSMPGGSSGPTA